jgi:hypothetical protein
MKVSNVEKAENRQNTGCLGEDRVELEDNRGAQNIATRKNMEDSDASYPIRGLRGFAP